MAGDKNIEFFVALGVIIAAGIVFIIMGYSLEQDLEAQMGSTRRGLRVMNSLLDGNKDSLDSADKEMSNEYKKYEDDFE